MKEVKLKSVNIFTEQGSRYYEVGQYLIINDKKTNIKVNHIETDNTDKVITISYSNGETSEFVGFNYITTIA